ncbi:hypothetical protein VIGAN_05100700 [Vigna angularis var. angularis]|uniref:Uncharacterized protein n=1 Tax=Vigna angularis var. angularis TaxID=157739 RepID=A0A0S3S468_PHAAN|nr:hypothetical protein VIGAN_05100700 [Vigna angularis var. angularis]
MLYNLFQNVLFLCFKFLHTVFKSRHQLWTEYRILTGLICITDIHYRIATKFWGDIGSRRVYSTFGKPFSKTSNGWIFNTGRDSK